MKSFREHIREEWLYSDKRIGEIFKNPTSREWKEYISGVTDYGIAGIYQKGNVYVFAGETIDGYDRVYHETVLKQLKLKNTKQTILFRASLKGTKIDGLHFGGRDLADLMSFKKDDAYQARMYIELYNHKSLKPQMANPMIKTIIDMVKFMGPDQFEDATGIRP